MVFFLVSEMVRADKVDSLSVASDATLMWFGTSCRTLLALSLANAHFSRTGSQTSICHSFSGQKWYKQHLQVFAWGQKYCPVIDQQFSICSEKKNSEWQGDRCQLVCGFNILRFGFLFSFLFFCVSLALCTKIAVSQLISNIQFANKQIITTTKKNTLAIYF